MEHPTPPPEWFALRAPVRHEIDKIKGSRFIARAAPVLGADEAAALVETARAAHPDANHHAWAYRLGRSRDVYRYSDDGEPSGSAGRPILQQIDARHVTNVAVVVSRIFGGTKLGVGGLIRAYGGAAAAALDHAVLEPLVVLRRLRVTHAYDLSAAVRAALVALGVEPQDAHYGETVRFTLVVPEDRADTCIDTLRERTAGRATVELEPPPATGGAARP